MNTKTIENFRRSLRRIERALFSQLKDGISCCGISLPQCHVILEIGNLESASIARLTERLGLDKSTLSRTIDGLVDLGAVQRISDPGDRRYVKLSLTPSGKKIYSKINLYCNEDYEHIFQYIPGKKHAQVIESIALLAGAITSAHKEAADTGASCICQTVTAGKENDRTDTLRM